MNKVLYLTILFLIAVFSFSKVSASEEGQQSELLSADEIVAMCEDKYGVESYSDDEERNNLIDKCINDSIGDTKEVVEES